MKILIVEDEKKVASFIMKGLQEEGFHVDAAYDGEEGLNMAVKATYDLILLDLSLPKKNGLTVIEDLRKKNVFTPILCMSANDTVEDIVTGLNIGSDGYLTKPFSFIELLARSRALIRRGSRNRGSELSVADMRLDRVSHRLWRGQQEITITPQEYRLIEYFMSNPNRVLTRSMIAENAWDSTFDPYSNIIDVYINYLRKKIDHGFDDKLIRTVRGAGYALKE
ncbi:MAG: response regulator transcription factor [Deltaproteobacteria bacterium]|nr:response regulator transcription factor [Deltaproteobacteria bacterium]MCW8892379.1 response regulator transcription factor [Deltaproteobacteria bacterium]MCW9050074.1 response regulator transcription factor [Deltaproteobacteria bacterium]